MLEPDVKVIRTVEDSRYLLDGTRVAIIRVEFMVGTHGPFVERMPKDGYSALVRDMKLNDFAREVRTT
jgi:hypothetical protein